MALNSLRNNGGFDQRVKEMLSTKCPSDDAAPASPVYEFLGLVGAVMVRREESEWGSVVAVVVRGEERRVGLGEESESGWKCEMI